MFLIVGGDSEIGSVVLKRARERGLNALATTRRRDMVGPERIFLDLETPDEGWGLPEGLTAACICAAVARLADCVNDPERARHVNVDRTLNIAHRLSGSGIYTLFLSTNQVFDGTKPHLPADAPLCPVSAYGKLKADAERALQAMMRENAPIGILRLAKVVSPGMALLTNWRAKLVAACPVWAFRDMTMAPVPVGQVADAILHLMETRASVIAQLSGPHDMAYADVARLIADVTGADPALVREMSARDYGQPEGATPKHTTLDSYWLGQAFGIEVAPAEEVVKAVIDA